MRMISYPPVWALDGDGVVFAALLTHVRGKQTTDYTILLFLQYFCIFGRTSGGECISGNTKLEKEYFRTYIYVRYDM